MLTNFFQEIRNWFVKEQYFGDFTITNNTVLRNGEEFLVSGQYFRISGSLFNDGVYKYGDTLKNENFDGSVWSMAVPPEVIELVGRISAWQETYGGAASQNMSPFQSESFGGYSYNKGSVSTASSASSVPTWQSVFADDLNRWRKI